MVQHPGRQGDVKGTREHNSAERQHRCWEGSRREQESHLIAWRYDCWECNVMDDAC